MSTEHGKTVSLPAAERILLGPGPSPVSPRVMRAMVAPVLSHLDPDMLRSLVVVPDRQPLIAARVPEEAGPAQMDQVVAKGELALVVEVIGIGQVAP